MPLVPFKTLNAYEIELSSLPRELFSATVGFEAH